MPSAKKLTVMYFEERRPIVEPCVGCAHVKDEGREKFCDAFIDPGIKWSMGPCNLATHVVRNLGGEVRRVNPLKASKKAASGGR